jgi:NADPH2:quinone reductase
MARGNPAERLMLQKVVRSTVIDAPIARVWAVLRDFNSHDQWHDVVAQSRIEAASAATRWAACVASRWRTATASASNC